MPKGQLPPSARPPALSESERLAAVHTMLDAQATQLRRMERSAQKRVHGRLVEARRRLLDELLTSAGGASFDAQHYRVVLARVQVGIGALDRDFGQGLTESATEAYALADAHLREQIATYSGVYEGTVRKTSWAPLAAIDDEVLLDHYDASIRVYGTGLIQRIQNELAVSLATEAPWTDIMRRVAGQSGILAQDYFGMASDRSHRQSRAERIVRTELSWAYNRAHHANLVAANEADPGYQKTLVATFDPRTGDDSRYVNGQVRELNELFEDNEGRRYMHPPNRPNDREVEIPTRPEWR